MAHIRFDHGLGDAANYAHVLALAHARGHGVAVDCPPDKAPLFAAAGCEVRPGGPTEHHYWHPPAPGEPGMHDHWAGNKVAWNLTDGPVRLGDYWELWGELCRVRLRLPDPPAAVRDEIDGFVRQLDGPLVLVHTRGNTGAEYKNCTPEFELELYRELLDRTDGHLLLLDWDDRVSRVPHRRVRHLTDDFRRVTVVELGHLMARAALFVGIDSGPLHLTRFTDCPAVGVWHGHHPAHFALPRGRTAHVVGERFGVWNRTRRHEYHLVDVPAVTGAAVAEAAAGMLRHRTGRGVVLDHVRRKLRTWGGGGYHDRQVTMGAALDHLGRRDRPRVIETGCSRVSPRDFDDWTAGHSTYVFALLLDGLGGHLDSVDVTEEHVRIAREWVSWTAAARVHHADSRAWLASYSGPPADVLYLDSADVGTPAFEQVCLAELRAGLPHLRDDGLLLIDDTMRARGGWHGKGALAVPYLLDHGWRIVASGWQTLLARG